MSEELKPNYIEDLNKRLKTVKKQIKHLEKVVYKSNVKMNKKWWSDFDKLNQLNINELTIKSRIKNIGKNNGGIEPYHIDVNQIKNK